MNTYKKIYNYKYGKILLAVMVILSVLSFLFAALSFSDKKQTKAETLPTDFSAYLSSDIENQYVPSPQDICISPFFTAIVSGTDKLFIFENSGKKTEINFSEYFSAPNVSQVKILDEDTLLVFNFGTIEMIKYKEYPVVIEDLKDASGRVISGTNYDINEDYLTVIFGEADNGSCKIYKIDNGNLIETASFSGVNGKKPVSLNSANEIFYVSTEQNLCKRSISDILNYEVLSSVSPDKMIAKDDFLYLIESGKIYGLDILSKTLLTAKDTVDEDFELGNIVSPSGLCFNGENLMIADSSIPAVQEFSVEFENGSLSLCFTGFAIAKDKTAYNRIKKNGIVQTVSQKVAVLDENKLTVTGFDFVTPYKRENFINIIKGSDAVSGYLFNGFILGKDSVLLFNFEERTAKEYDFDLGIINTFDFTGRIIEGKYFNNVFYVLSVYSDTAYVYTIENSNISLLLKTEGVVGSATNHMCIDAYKNVYLTDTVNDKILKLNKTDGYSIQEEIPMSSANDVNSLSVDLGGGLFSLESDILVYYSNGARFEITLSFNNEDLSEISSFSLSLFDKTAFITSGKDELLRYTDNLPNMAISHVLIPSDFSTNGESANIDDLTVFKLKDDIETFNITINGNEFFEYSGFYYEDGKQLVKVYELTLSENYDTDTRYLTLYVISDGELYISFSEGLEDITSSVIEDAEYDTGYITTNVNAYYLPVVTDRAEYAIVNGDKVLRLIKKAKVFPLKQFLFEDKLYLFAKIDSDNGEVFGYIPAAFTVKTLSENADGETFIIREIKYATLYANEDMTGKICDIENATVRVYTEYENDTTCYISVDTENGRLFGYVDKTTVKEKDSYNLRNALIIIAVSLSVFMTSVFFILRKYKN